MPTFISQHEIPFLNTKELASKMLVIYYVRGLLEDKAKVSQKQSVNKYIISFKMSYLSLVLAHPFYVGP